MIADFKEREKTRIAQLEAVAEAKRIEKEEEAAKKAAEMAEAAAAARLVARQAAQEGGDDNATVDLAGTVAQANAHVMQRARSSGQKRSS
eukprot:scaffold28777_cov24-Tisochrysis_lutea.AAC.1